MKTIGLLGGMSWESTLSYYRAINEGVRQRLGGLHSAPIAMVSVDFEPIARGQAAGHWQSLAAQLSQAARQIESAGAECLLIATNTMHRVASEVESAISIPLLHIADATAAQLNADGVQRVGLLGTRFTMEQSFYRGRLEQHGLDVLTPDEDDRAEVHRVIFDELCVGVIEESSRSRYREAVQRLQDRGAEAIILGCTEIGLLLRPQDTQLALYDTAAIHARGAVAFALGEEQA